MYAYLLFHHIAPVSDFNNSGHVQFQSDIMKIFLKKDVKAMEGTESKGVLGSFL
jgi:hypothetical protein